MPESRLKRGRWYGWVFWGLAALFYLYEFFIRILPSAVLPQIEQEMHIGPAALGWSMSAYLWVYAPMQLLVGVLFDKFGTRWLMATATAACALGTLMLADVTSLGSVSVARGIQGFGSAFAYVGTMYVATVWFPPHRLAMIAGMSAGVGMFGQIIGETPLVTATERFGLHDVLVWTAGLGIVLAILIAAIIPSRPSWFHERFADDDSTDISMVAGLLTVLKSRYLWMVGIISAVMYLPLSVTAALWGTTFIKQAGGYSLDQATFAITSLAIGSLIGFPVAGYISDRIGSRRIPLLIGALGGGVLALLMLWPAVWTYWGLMALMFVAGLLTGPQTVTFAVAMELSPKSLRATAVACCNLLAMLIAAGFQVVIGWLLTAELHAVGVHASHTQADLLAQATPAEFQWAMTVIPAAYVLAIVLCFVIPETAPRRDATLTP